MTERKVIYLSQERLRRAWLKITELRRKRIKEAAEKVFGPKPVHANDNEMGPDD